MQASPIRIGVIGFDGVNGIDLAGPVEVFANAGELDREAGEARRYEIVILGLTRKAFTTDSGMVIQPRRTLADAPRLDTLIVPGGTGLRAPRTQAAIAAWLRERGRDIRRVCSVCTG
ncbi:MAG TPA: DJ-1/PfpI family protein, partial [Terriglobales bacterium]|nr:DJ-1/PfpI family protein [Terriglobales bacterium]